MPTSKDDGIMLPTKADALYPSLTNTDNKSYANSGFLA